MCSGKFSICRLYFWFCIRMPVYDPVQCLVVSLGCCLFGLTSFWVVPLLFVLSTSSFDFFILLLNSCCKHASRSSVSCSCNFCRLICFLSSIAFHVVSVIHLSLLVPRLQPTTFTAAYTTLLLKLLQVCPTSSTASRAANLLDTYMLNSALISGCLSLPTSNTWTLFRCILSLLQLSISTLQLASSQSEATSDPR